MASSTTIIYNPTDFIQQSVDAVVQTILEAIVLVVLVVILFLQTWRAAIIPIVAIPVSLVGTFFLMAAFGFSLNNLSLFGLVLAIGIVVDDAIVVVENVERNMAKGLSPREASYRTMEEVGTALIAIALVLTAVFVPSAFITGISGQFYRQFALTIAGATIISLIVSLTLSPALCALLLKPHGEEHKHRPAVCGRSTPSSASSTGASTSCLTATVGSSGRVVRIAVLMLVVYAGVIAFGMNEFRKTPDRLHSAAQDAGYLITITQLPPAASLDRTDAVNRRAVELALDSAGRRARGQPRRLLGCHAHERSERGRGVRRAEAFRGARQGSAHVGAGDPGRAACQVLVDPGRPGARRRAAARARHRQRRRIPHDGARIVGGNGSAALQGAVGAMMGEAAQTPGLKQVFSLFENVDAAALSRHRSRQGADARHQRLRCVRRTADLPRLRLRQRLQSARAAPSA